MKISLASHFIPLLVLLSVMGSGSEGVAFGGGIGSPVGVLVHPKIAFLKDEALTPGIRRYELVSTMAKSDGSVQSFLDGKPEEAPTEPPAQVLIVGQNPGDLIGWWTGDETVDDSLKKNNARLYGTATYAPGMVGQAFKLDGNKSYVKISTSDLDPGKGMGFTLDLWVKPDELTHQQPLAGWSASTTPGASLWLEPAEAGGLARIGADLRDTAGGAHRILSEFPVVKAGKWQHIALDYRKDTGVVSLFCNGKLVKERNVGEIAVETSLDFYIGKHAYIGSGEVTFKGLIDEVCLYSRGLGPAEIQAFYEAASAGKQLFAERDSTLTADQRWQVRNKRMGSFSSNFGGQAMSFGAKIDGSDFVHIRGDKVWYVHRSWQLPGKQGGTNDPTFVNGVEWFPTWTGNTSDKFTLTSALPDNSESVLHIDALKLGGDLAPTGPGSGLTITQAPTAANGYEAVLLLNDDSDGGSHWFIFNVAWNAPEKVSK